MTVAERIEVVLEGVIRLALTSFSQLEDEPPLQWERMVMMDGNNSLKRVARKCVADTRVLETSDYFISTNFVNKYAHEVKPQSKGETETLDAEVAEDQDGGYPTDGSRVPHTCAERWKTAMADRVRRLWALFEETGGFAACCRHGFLLWIMDMIRSGEL